MGDSKDLSLVTYNIFKSRYVCIDTESQIALPGDGGGKEEKICLIQLYTGSHTYLIDFMETPDIFTGQPGKDFAALFRDELIVKVGHAFNNDWPNLEQLEGLRNILYETENFHDTQEMIRTCD